MKNVNLHGFVIEKEERVDYLDATLVSLRHEKTRMPLFFLDRPDNNKSFAIGFITKPQDDSGVFHIIEHSVLCGSKKYPVKEPFAELMKSTVSTYLNALTYQRFTLYPVSSYIDKALFDMMDVYLDAVFNPLVLENENIFLQEGHRFEIDEDGNLEPNGVVFNEMRDGFMTYSSLTSLYTSRILEPGGPGGFCSGGVPKDILNLSYQDFKRILREHYHPSNAFCFLDGSVDIERALALIDEYISAFEYKEYPSLKAPEIEPLTEPQFEYYPITDEENNSTKLLCYNTIKSKSDEEEELNAAAFTILIDALASSENSPLQEAVLNMDLCTKMSISLYNVNTICTAFAGVEEGKELELVDKYHALLEERLDEFIDKSDLLASLNSYEFFIREQDYGQTPRGIEYICNMADYYADGQEAVNALTYVKHYATLRSLVGTDFFHALARKHLINGKLSILSMRPTTEEMTDGVDEAVLEIANRTSEEERSLLAEKVERLKAWQDTADTEEALDTIPKLQISDIEFVEDKTPTLLSSCLDARVLLHPISTCGINYLNLYFDVTDLNPEELVNLQLFLAVFRNFERENLPPGELEVLVKTHLGEFGRQLSVFRTKDGGTKVYMRFTTSFIEDNTESALELIRRIITTPVLNNPTVVEKRIARWLDSRKESYLSGSTNSRVATCGYDSLGYINENIFGLRFYDRVLTLGPKGCGALSEAIIKIYERVITQKRLTLGITGSLEVERLIPLVSGLKAGEEIIPYDYSTHPEPKNHVITTDEAVAKTALASSLPTSTDNRDSATGRVLASILDYEVLWNEIRIKGGAYSTGILINRNRGIVLCYSASDPNPTRSIEVFRNIGGLSREFIESCQELDSFIISAYSDATTLRTPRIDGERSNELYLAGRELKEMEDMRRTILTVTKDELLEASDLLSCLKEGTYSVMCSEEMAEQLSGEWELYYRL